MAGVAFDPVPLDVMPLDGSVEPLPQIDVLDRLLVGGLPAVALPAVNPFRYAVVDVLAVAIAPINSMRLLVVCASPPFSSFSCSPYERIAPQPPGPGLPEQAPSVWMMTCGPSVTR
jgi:hypothetical protein